MSCKTVPNQLTLRKETRMADLPSHPNTNDDHSESPEPGQTLGKPGRVPVLGIVVAVVLIVVFVGLHLTGVIGPGSH